MPLTLCNNCGSCCSTALPQHSKDGICLTHQLMDSTLDAQQPFPVYLPALQLEERPITQYKSEAQPWHVTSKQTIQQGGTCAAQA